MYPFQFGQEYPRSLLLEFVGSKQQQAGVLWGSKSPGCLIITSGGRQGKKVGYFDERLPDGSWLYFGQGGAGDHSITNPANAKLSGGRYTVLLFSTREPTAAEVRQRGNYQKLFSFQGAFNVCNYETFIPPTGARKGDRLLRFLLAPAGLIPLANADVQTHPVSLGLLRERVRQYALLRAGGKCEACGCDAPFADDHGNGFLEVHHIHRLADEGIDAPENVAAICPNCHRRAHYSSDRVEFNILLAETIRNRETAISGEGAVAPAFA